MEIHATQLVTENIAELLKHSDELESGKYFVMVNHFDNDYSLFYVDEDWEFNNVVSKEISEKYGFRSWGTCTNNKNYELRDICTGLYVTPNNQKACKNYKKRYDDNG